MASSKADAVGVWKLVGGTMPDGTSLMQGSLFLGPRFGITDKTFASLLFAINEPPPYVMAQMGHTTANLTLAIYARQMDRRDGEPERLQALVNGDDLAQLSLRPAVAGGHPVGTRERVAVDAARS